MQTTLILFVLGRFLLGYALTMLVPALWATQLGSDCMDSLWLSMLLTLISGIAMTAKGKRNALFSIREGFAVVAGAWLLAAIYGTLPYILSGSITDVVDAWFESVSGLTTTGATTIRDFSLIPLPILLWRSLTHWLGGMGIIVLFIVLLPQLGVGATHLFKAEVPGPTSEKLAPRVRDMAITLWGIYVTLTVLQCLLLLAAGMDFFSALNYALATMSTGGFAIGDAGIAAYDSPLIEIIITLFMVVSGTRFALYYLAWRSGAKKILADTEFRAYLTILFCVAVVISIDLHLSFDQAWPIAVRSAIFQTASLMSTTGFMLVDYEQWPSLSRMLLLMLMIIGGCAGSAAGGLKVSRIIILVKQSWEGLRRVIHPRVISVLHVDGKAIDSSVPTAVLQFFFLYSIVFFIGVLCLAATGLQPFEAIGAVAAALNNVGPGFGAVGPSLNYADVTNFGKIVLTACMLLGRLELVTLLVFLRVEFWRSQKGW